MIHTKTLIFLAHLHYDDIDQYILIITLIYTHGYHMDASCLGTCTVYNDCVFLTIHGVLT